MEERHEFHEMVSYYFLFFWAIQKSHNLPRSFFKINLESNGEQHVRQPS